MILPNMNFQEIKKNLLIDIDTVIRYTDKVIEPNYEKYRKATLKGKRKKETIALPRVYKYETPNKNKFYIEIERNTITKENTLRHYCFYFYNEKGLKTYQLMPSGMIASHNGHFFSRYNERLGLDLTMPKRWIRHFLIENGICRMFNTGEAISKNVYRVMGRTKQGVKLGFIDTNIGLTTWNTFLTFDMLAGDQKEVVREIEESLLPSLIDPFHNLLGEKINYSPVENLTFIMKMLNDQ